MFFRYYSKHSVPADKKWEDIFHHCSLLLGYSGQGKADTAKAWEAVAIMITAGRDTVKELTKRWVLGYVRNTQYGLQRGHQFSYI